MKPNQCHAAVLLAAGNAQAHVAAQLKIHPETIRNWMKRPDFKAMLALETKNALEKLRNARGQALLTEIQRIEKCGQNGARTSVHGEFPRTLVPLARGGSLPLASAGSGTG